MEKIKKFSDSKVIHSWQFQIPNDYDFRTLINQERRIFTIPVGNISTEEAERTIQRLIGQYNTNVYFPEDLQVNNGNIEIVDVPGYVPTIVRRDGPTPMHPII